MKCYTGIDLGSTTTKAIVMDEDEVVLGRGITNSRSNYDVACAVAKSEAFVNARFGLFSNRLAGLGLGDEARAELTESLERNFRRRQFERQLEVLGERVGSILETDRYAEIEKELAERVETVLSRMADEVPDTFSPGARKRSDFFRDLAASSWMRHAEEVAGGSVGFDLLMSVFDKSIIEVENRELDLSFSANVLPALGRVVTELGGEWERREEELRTIVTEVAATDLTEERSVGTGYGRSKLPFPKEQIRSEILCHGMGAHWLFPNTRTVLDIGGQDTKAIQVDAAGVVTSFQMNDRCAAGSGRYLGYIADEMNLGVHELGPLASRSNRPIRITSTCTVFAGAELRDRLSLGDRREDILAGLHRAMMLRAMSLLARSGGVEEEFTFTGGVAKNQAAVSALTDLVRLNYGERTMNISPDSIYTGAIGAAIFARRGMTEDREAA